MTKRAMTVLTLATLGMSGAALASDTATAPDAGSYLAEVYVQSAGSGCLDKAGYAFVGELSFSGLSGTTYTLRALESGSDYAVNSIQTLTVKSGKGTTKPSGALAWKGAGVGGSWSYTGTFTSAITEIDAHDFILQLHDVYTGCSSEDINVDLARMGVNQ